MFYDIANIENQRERRKVRYYERLAELSAQGVPI